MLVKTNIIKMDEIMNEGYYNHNLSVEFEIRILLAQKTVENFHK